MFARSDAGQVATLIEPYAGPGLEEDFRGFEWWYLQEFLKGDQAAILEGHENMIASLAFSRDGRRLVSGDLGGVVHVWDVGTGRHLATPHRGDSRVVGVSVSHDDQFLAVGDRTHLRVYSMTDFALSRDCLLYTSPSPRDLSTSRMPSSA